MPSKTAERLTEAVLLSIREHGYAGTSMQELLKSTGVSSSSMYHFFPGGKEELVATAVRRSGLEAAEQIREVFAHHPLERGVRLIFEAAAKEMEGHGFALGCPIGVPATEASSDSERIQQAVSEVFDAWAEAYQTALVDAGHGEDGAERLGRFIVATYEGAVTLARATKSTEPYRDAAELVSQLAAT